MDEQPLEISAEDFARIHDEGDVTLVDVREPAEYRSGHLPGAELVPMRAVADKAAELPRDEPVYVICATGNRSRSMTEVLRRAGIEAYSVAGGTQGWAVGAPGRELVAGAYPVAQHA
ncbi:MAG TPA: rhodanese-like domain-containing protein [Ornithinimicrobium sp.]|nr:rhodanese-like domain-containing protein [Ornithinimicrobium sp.]